MKCSRLASLACLLSVFLSSPAFAGGDDPLIKLPDMFVVLDNSGSMTSCGMTVGSTCIRSRMTAAQEVLSGTFTGYVNTPYLTTTGSCPTRAKDGILSLYRDFVRFGYSSFDDEKGSQRYGEDSDAYGDDPKTTIGTVLTKGRGIKGRSSGTTIYNKCSSATAGCLIDVVKPSDPGNIQANNDLVQAEVCRTKNHMSTPVAGSLYDVRYYFDHYEAEIGYTDPMGRHGGQCRPQFALLLTDGEEWPTCTSCPGLTDGHYCAQAHGGDYANNCAWYGNEAKQAKYLYDSGVPVFVVGFGNMTADLRQHMHAIARAGQGMAENNWWVDAANLANLEAGAVAEPKAFIVQDQSALKVALALIIDSVLAGSVSRTSSSTAPSSTSYLSTFEYSAWFELGITGITWNGFLAQTKFCDSDSDGVADDQCARKVVAWDNYDIQPGEQLVHLPTASTRKFLTITTDPRSKTFYNPTTGVYNLPRYETLDQTGLFPFYATSASDSSKDFSTSLMCLTDTGEGYTLPQLARVIKAYVRGVNGIQGISGMRQSLGPQLGDIFHSSPVVVPPPSALTPDYRYEALFQEYKKRHTMVYAGANDGLLHAFVGEDNDDSNGVTPALTELWAFMPTRILSTIQRIRGSGHSFYVDGTPIVRDLYLSHATVPDGNPKANDCMRDTAGNCLKGAYRTVLIGGLRGGGDVYYALDVTDPLKPGYLWEYRTGMPPDDGNASTTYDDYLTNQCNDSLLQTWAEPVTGQVWLKRPNNEYLGKSVVIVPGGYMPRLELGDMNSCVQLLEAMVNGTTLHVLDAETGALMRKFTFSDNPNIEDYAETLQQFYADVAADPTKQWNQWNNGNAFNSGDFNEANAQGWRCGEKRGQIGTATPVPEGLIVDQYCVTTSNEGDIAFAKCCCTNSSGNSCANKACSNMNMMNNCSYRYVEYTNGNVLISVKTEGCYLAPSATQGRFEVMLGGNISSLESVAATPVGYNSSVGSFLTRLFVVAANGKVYRVDMQNAQYVETAPEGQQIVPYASDATKDWKAALWFDPVDPAYLNPPQPSVRPVTVTPALAMDGERSLVLYYGTGQVDNLSYVGNQQEYFYAVREARDPTDPFKYLAKGVLVDKKTDFQPAERLVSKPLVISGKVFFSTYQPLNDACGSGTSRIYGLMYDDFDSAENPLSTPITNPGPPEQIKERWLPTGPQVVSSGGGTSPTPLPGVPPLEPKAVVLSWGQVL